MKKLFLATLLLAAIIIAGVGVSSIAAQTTTTNTPTPVATSNGTPTGPTNSAQGNLIICSNSAILDFNGNMLSGYDIVYQIFSGSDTSGAALTGIRHVAAVGTGYAVSDRANFINGQTVATGASGTAKVTIQNERNGKADFTFNMTDSQDGCNNPANPLVSTADLAPSSTAEAGSGSSSGSSATSTSSGQTGAGITVSIFAPNGGTLNPNLAAEGAVVVGPRPSDRFRSATPGLIFAQCDSFPLALPGIIYDDDTITIFWSWFTHTNAEMTQELANAIYTVHLNTAPLPMTTLSTPVARDGNVWVFYTATVGNLRPGHYEVGFLHTWANPVNDGYNDYGPGTARPTDSGTCNFDVTPNPTSTSVAYSGMYFPSLYATHDLFPNR